MLIGRIPMAAVTPEMLQNPGLMLLSPFFVVARDDGKQEAQASNEQDECDCCPCCGCTCDCD